MTFRLRFPTLFDGFAAAARIRRALALAAGLSSLLALQALAGCDPPDPRVLSDRPPPSQRPPAADGPGADAPPVILPADLTPSVSREQSQFGGIRLPSALQTYGLGLD